MTKDDIGVWTFSFNNSALCIDMVLSSQASTHSTLHDVPGGRIIPPSVSDKD